MRSGQITSGIIRFSAIVLLATALHANNGVSVAPGPVPFFDLAPSRPLFFSRSVKGEGRLPGPCQAIKVEVALVTVPVVVTDKKGAFVSDLKQSDFRILENGAPQVIDRLIPDADPFHVALMIDGSGSTHFKFGDMQDAALEFIDALRPQDRILVVSFGNEVHIDSDFTADRERLRRLVREMTSEGRQTHLYDALEKVMKERFDRIPGRKAIVLFSDGVDNESLRAGSADTLATIEKSDIVAYAIQYDTRKDFVPDRLQVPPPPGYPSFNTLYRDAVKYLRAFTGHSGGRVYHAGTAVALRDAFAQIAEELRGQYTLCYYPANQKRDGSFRRIRVTVGRAGASVRARTGYRAGK